MDLVGRLGGEEFAVLLPCTTLEEGQTVAERLRRSIEETRFAVGEVVLPVTASVGLANVRMVTDSAELVSQADRALYAAKKAGRNRAHFHSVAGSGAANAGRKRTGERGRRLGPTTIWAGKIARERPLNRAGQIVPMPERIPAAVEFA